MHVICSRCPTCLVASLPGPKAGWLGPRAFQATLAACCSLLILAPLKDVHVCGLTTRLVRVYMRPTYSYESENV